MQKGRLDEEGGQLKEKLFIGRKGEVMGSVFRGIVGSDIREDCRTVNVKSR